MHRLPPRSFARYLLCCGSAALAALAWGEPPRRIELSPAEASSAAQAIERAVPVVVADGMRASVWASESLMIDPVGIDVDDQGRAWVSTTRRRRSSMFDIRNHADWVAESWSWTTVEERRAFLRRELSPERSAENDWLQDFNGDGSRDWRDLRVERDEIYRLEDRSGDGRADRSLRYADLPTDELTDIAGTVLYHEGDLYVGMPPELWRWRDLDGDENFESKTSISSGYGIHIGFGGHGLSGLKVGPDGRIYWGIGDIGFNGVDQEGRRWEYPREGVLVRCEPDGSGFEVYARGLRNVHEFDWDAFGNLIGVDNDGDHAGEEERLVYLIDGSDTGWRNNWQIGKYTDPKNNPYKVWMDEGYAKPRFEGQAAHILPTLGNYHTGPAGLVFQPGLALGGRWRDHFFVASFTGNPANSSLYAFSLEPDGASFRLVGDERIMQGVTAVGIDFGPDGALYLADWAGGWDTDGIGRIWKLDTVGQPSRKEQETRDLLEAGFSERKTGELGQLLGHGDRRVRLGAQFVLAERGESEALLSAAAQGENQLARIHGIWGVGQLARAGRCAPERLLPLAEDGDPEIRAQLARVWGDLRYAPVAGLLEDWLGGGPMRIQLLATEALGRIGAADAFGSIVEMLERHEDKDVYLRHAGAVALARIDDGARLAALAEHPSRAVRIAAVVALKRLEHPGVVAFLSDADSFVVENAARAIGDDAFIEEGLPALAELLGETPFDAEPLVRRMVNANLYSGRAEDALRLARFAAETENAAAMRIEAIDTLSVWPDASVYDRVTGMVRDVPQNQEVHAQAALASVYDTLLADDDLQVRLAALEALGALAVEESEAVLLARVAQGVEARERVAALQALQAMKSSRLVEAIETALRDEAEAVSLAALGMTPELEAEAAVKASALLEAWSRVGLAQKQVILQTLAALETEASQAFFAEQLQALKAGQLPGELHLELAQAIEGAGTEELRADLAGYRARMAERGPTARHAFALRGGDAGRGRDIVFHAPAAQCIRCHAIDGQGGDVGPELAGIGSSLEREALLRSLVDPSAEIAAGFGIVTVDLEDGGSVQGILREESDSSLVVETGPGELRRLAKSAVASVEAAPSSMPPMGLLLDESQLRDVVAYLASLREE